VGLPLEVGATYLSYPALLMNIVAILCSAPKASAEAVQVGSRILLVNHTNRLQRSCHNESITKPIKIYLDGSS
jgi:hypothetical protein